MVASVKGFLDRFMQGFTRRNPGQPEFYQAVCEVALDVVPFTQENPIYNEPAVSAIRALAGGSRFYDAWCRAEITAISYDRCFHLSHFWELHSFLVVSWRYRTSLARN